MKITLFIIMSFFLSNYIHGQYQISAGVFSNGGAAISNSSFQISSTVGQTFIGQAQGDSFKKQVGFWYQHDIVPSVEEIIGEIPTEYHLLQNYPNPFNPLTTIRFALKERSKVELAVFNLLGQSVATLFDDELDVGWYEAHFFSGNLASGVYVYRIIANQFVQSRKMIFLK